ncbi:MAG: YkgJ family cysteine cluster protein [Desulfobacterium sp.]|nr:YkgJ family cysteine cluster protein [Desulfobacterium sp.]
MPQQDLRLDKLRQLYDLYDTFMAKTDLVCHKGCATCCTCNVTITSLELDYIKATLGSGTAESPRERVEKRLAGKRFQPKTTINGFARLCMEGSEIPEEENDPAWGECPLLLNNTCTIYPARPFGCRSLVSQEDCSRSGVATLSPLVLTVNNLFMQYIEQMDCNGISGNLSDMILTGSSPSLSTGIVTISNQAVPVLMVPPEHREQVGPLLQDMAGICNG